MKQKGYEVLRPNSSWSTGISPLALVKAYAAVDVVFLSFIHW